MWAYLPIFGTNTSFPDLPEDLQPAYKTKAKTATFVRDMPYSFDMAIENVFDASHIPFAHHRVFSSRSDACETIGYTMSSLADKEKCVVGHTNTLHGKSRKDVVTFIPPAHYFFTDNHTSNGDLQIKLMISAVPIAPGKTRLLLTTPYKPFWRNLMPKWLSHATLNRFLESDIWVYDIERFVRIPHNDFRVAPLTTISTNGNQSQQNSYKVEEDPILGTRQEAQPRYAIATKADRGILHWRRWWKTYLAHLSPIFAANYKQSPWIVPLSATERRERLFSHIRYCKHCQHALQRAQWLQITLAPRLGFAALSILLLRFAVFANYSSAPLFALPRKRTCLFLSYATAILATIVHKIGCKVEKTILGKEVLEPLSVSRLA